MFYDKKIRYLDYCESGSRIKGAGYVKLEARDQNLRMELTVTSLRPTDSFESEVLLCTGEEEKSVGTILISEGRGQYLGQWSNSDSIGGTGIAYTALEGIHIPLGASREITCRWQKKQFPSSTVILPGKEETLSQMSSQKVDETLSQTNSQKADETLFQMSSRKAEGILPQKESQKEVKVLLASAEAPQKSSQKAETPKPEFQSAHEPSPAKSPEQVEIQAAAEPVQQKQTENRRESPARTPTVPQKLMENKWEQLWALYPHLRPFRDKREYLSIKPADFVIFSSSSYRMINNSFLLHGYYNYKHLILARMERKGEIHYYIGVPGNFFEKEKQVAIMFGFESFECAEEPAQAGDFGYYMMRIEI